jgi:hypothetical protein
VTNVYSPSELIDNNVGMTIVTIPELASGIFGIGIGAGFIPGSSTFTCSGRTPKNEDFSFDCYGTKVGSLDGP